MTAAGGRLDARAIGHAVFAMAALGGSYTTGKFALQDLPVFGVLIGWAAPGETMGAPQALGAVAVAAGILIVMAER